MKKRIHFDVESLHSIANALQSGLIAYAINTPKVGPPTTLWLHMRNGLVLKVTVAMHDLRDWEEIGTLRFDMVDIDDAPKMTALPLSWLKIRDVQKLIFDSDECEAECGFSLYTCDGNQLVVVPGADVYTLAIRAPFYLLIFNPENDLDEYISKSFWAMV